MPKRGNQSMPSGTVYIVDDDPALLSNISALVKFAGYAVRFWNDPQAFLAELPNHAPAVLITDMHMPGRSGIEIHKALLERGRRLPVIYISGKSSARDAIGAMKLDAHDFLIKPFSREELLAAVGAAIERDRHAMHAIIERARLQEAMVHLSPREREVRNLLMQGYSNAEIVQTLGISLETAKQYKSEVMRKMGARSLSHFMAINKTLDERSSETSP